MSMNLWMWIAIVVVLLGAGRALFTARHNNGVSRTGEMKLYDLDGH